MNDKPVWNCEPYWELGPYEKLCIDNAVALGTGVNGTIPKCHAQCRKCGQYRLVSNPLGARWCRRCQQLFPNEYKYVGEPFVIATLPETPTHRAKLPTATKIFAVALVASVLGVVLAKCKVRFKFGWMP